MQDVIFNTYAISQNSDELQVDEFGFESFEKRLIFLPPRISSVYMLHYVIKGEGTLTLDGKIYPLKKGALFLCPPNVKLTYHSSTHSPYSYFWINFIGKSAETKINSIGLSKETPVIYPQNAEQITRIFNNLLNFTSPETQEMAISHLHALFYYAKNDKRTSIKKIKSLYVEKTINYIDHNYRNPELKISHIAEELHLSLEYLSKIFKEETKTTIISFLISKRMQESNKLIKSGLSVSESAEKCGYTDLCNFSKTYKNHFGYPPSKTI